MKLLMSRSRILVTYLIFVAIQFACVRWAHGQDNSSAEQLDFFESKIRPVLVGECYSCHSAEAATKGKLRGGLLLDSRAAIRQGGDSGPAVVPQHPEKSLLLSAMKHEEFEMPPKGKLAESVIADFEKWIQSGAEDPRDGKPIAAAAMDVQSSKSFWSFQPLANPQPPAAKDASKWVRSDIDRFILAAIEERSIAPNPIAEPRVLVRRAWFDLLGLPPTPDEMRTWCAKLQSPAGEIDAQAWSALIDHLLDSPHYGERQARHWIDVARFAESHGYEQDYDRPNAFHYRDFLIQAFNRDLPYDQFVHWQLAGDELAPEEPLAWMATGFLCGGAFPTQLTEAEFESARYDELDDMAATTGVAFLGLSIGCARCHDHKFDPIPSLDYYRIASTFTTAIRCEKKLDLDPQKNAQRREAYAAKISKLENELQNYASSELPQQFYNWLRSERGRPNEFSTWSLLKGTVSSKRKGNFQLQPDGAFLSVGEVPASDEIKFTCTVQTLNMHALRLEALSHETLPKKGPGRADNGNFALTDIRLSLADSTQEIPKFISARATHQQNADSLSVAAAIDADPVSGWAVDGQIGKDQAAVFQLERPLVIEQPTELTVTLTFKHTNPKHSIGCFRLSVSADPAATPEIGKLSPPTAIVEAIEQLRSAVIVNQLASVAQHNQWLPALEWFQLQDAGYRERAAAVERAKQTGTGETLTTALVTSEGLPILSHHANDRGFPHFYPETYQLRRGDVSQKIDKVEAGFLQVLTSTESSSQRWRVQPAEPDPRLSYRRSALARWITDTEQGAGQLAARVMANRLWQHHFGRGLVASPNDFGASGERPTHPQLLDYMAFELIDGGWQLKRLHKLIMTSSVYMQASTLAADDNRLTIDRENQLHWRRVPRRLEAEAIRDAMLLVSGQLDRTMYGPGTLDASMRRRSIYFFIKRSQLVPMMMLFDWPEHLVSIGQRPLTTIAPQALMFMNNVQGREYAIALARQIYDQTTERIENQPVDRAYWMALSRAPNSSEVKLAQQFLAQQTTARQQHGEADAPLLALADLCQTLMSMNEFVYVD